MIESGKYKHSKTGNLYKVLGEAKHSETLEELVVYETLYENKESKLWVRPLSMFKDLVIVGGEKKKRFEYIKE